MTDVDKLINKLKEYNFEFISESIEGKYSKYYNNLCLWFDYIGDDIKFLTEDDFNSYESFYNYAKDKQTIVKNKFNNFLKKEEISKIIMAYEYEDYRVGYTNIFIFIKGNQTIADRQEDELDNLIRDSYPDDELF